MSYAYVDDEPGYADEGSTPDWQLEQEIDDLHAELDKLAQEAEELRAAISQEQEERAREAAEQQLEIEELRLENARLRSSRAAALHRQDAVYRKLQECEEGADALRADLARWNAELSAVMPADFKDWTSTSERPQLAAWVIRNLRERLAEALEWRDAAQEELRKCQQDAISLQNELAALRSQEPRTLTNQCGETCERAKLCATCARGLETSP